MLTSARLSVLEATAINLIQCYFYSQNGMCAPASELPYMVYCGESEHSDTSPSLSLGTVSGPRASRCPWVLMTHESLQILKWDGALCCDLFKKVMLVPEQLIVSDFGGLQE